MADARGRWQRQNNVACAALAAGSVKNVRGYLETGDLHAIERPPPIDDRVREYRRAIEANGGRFMMPDEVEKWLAENPRREQ